MKLTPANINNAKEINTLLNLSYRGEKGWTTENNLVSGDRATLEEVQLSISNYLFLIYKNAEVIIACICLEEKGRDIYIGSFAVHPEHQSHGLGSAVLSAAEHYAITKLKAKKLTMFVLSERTELISFYQRRDYKLSGINKEYPVHLNIGIPKYTGLTIVQLHKNV